MVDYGVPHYTMARMSSENDYILLQTQPSRNHNCSCCAGGSIFERAD